MHSAINIRSAEPRDSEAIVDLVRLAFPAATIERSIYGCHGVERWLAAELSLHLGLRRSRYVVAQVGREVAGFAELVDAGTDVFLNYIAVADQLTRQAIGSRLLVGGLESTSAQGRLVLDVLDDNDRARRWYDLISCVPVGKRYWLELSLQTSLSSPESPSPCHVSGFAVAMKVLDEYGFAEITLAPSVGAPLRIGLLGGHYFRVPSPDVTTVPGVVDTLQLIDSSRTLLVTDVQTRPSWRTAISATTMSGDLPDVLRSLQGRLSSADEAAQ